VKKVELLGNGVGRNGRKKVWGGRVLTQHREREREREREITYRKRE
jgi:hypothetical protein